MAMAGLKSSLRCDSAAFLVPLAGAGSPPAFAPLCAIKNSGFPSDSKKPCRNLYHDVDEEVSLGEMKLARPLS